MQIAVIINPVSGTRNRAGIGRRRADLAADHLARRGHQADIMLTEYGGHARALAIGAIERGAELVCAWGGDGTMNEVASVLADGDVPLGVIPSGSGNGLARELGIPIEPRAAFDAVLGAPTCRIDAGELDGRPFFNVAGLGLDAAVAHRFAGGLGLKRGLAGYVRLAIAEARRYEAPPCRVCWDDRVLDIRPLVLAVANSRQYGNGALIAPQARLDDGALDLVAVADRRFWRAALDAPALFSGRIARVTGVETARATTVTITSDRPLLCHVDGEPVAAGISVTIRVRPGALSVRAPAYGASDTEVSGVRDRVRRETWGHEARSARTVHGEGPAARVYRMFTAGGASLDRRSVLGHPMFARHLTHDGHSRRFSIAPAADRGWEVRDEHDSQVLRHVCYDDWHRVERARMEFLFQTAQLERSGWRLQV